MFMETIEEGQKYARRYEKVQNTPDATKKAKRRQKYATVTVTVTTGGEPPISLTCSSMESESEQKNVLS